MTDYQFAYLTSTNRPGFLSAPPLADTSLSAMRAVLQPKASELISRHHMVWLDCRCCGHTGHITGGRWDWSTSTRIATRGPIMRESRPDMELGSVKQSLKAW